MGGEVPNGGGSEVQVDLPEQLRQEIRGFAQDLPDLDYYAVLGIERGADADQIRKAFFDRSKTFHPDRYFNRELGSYEALLNEIYKRVVAAHEVIRDENLRREYDKTLGAEGPLAAREAPAAPSAGDASTPAAGTAEAAQAPPGCGEGKGPANPRSSPAGGRSLRERSGFRSRSGILKELESRLAASRERASEHFAIAIERAEAGSYGEAVKRVRTCLAFDPREPRYHEALADWLQQANAHEAHRVRRKADQLLHDGQIAEALPYLDEAVRLCPTDAKLAGQLAGLLLEVDEQLDRALEFAGRAVELEVDEPAHYKLRARLFEALGAEREARKDLQRAWELDPMDKDVKAALAVN